MRKIKRLRGTGKLYPDSFNGPDRPIISIDANGVVIRGRDHHHIELLLQSARQRNVPPAQRLIPAGLFDEALVRFRTNRYYGSTSTWLK